MVGITENSDHSPSVKFAPPALRRIAVDYGLAALAVAVALVIAFAFASILQRGTMYLLFVPAVLIGSAMGGVGPGILATILSLLVGLLLPGDGRAFSPPEALSAVVFALVGIDASWRGELLHRARVAAFANAETARAREAHVQSILDTVPEGMTVIDESGAIRSFSAAARGLHHHGRARARYERH